MPYENNIPGARITLHNAEGTASIGCFWLLRDSKRVTKHVTSDVAVVGNNYHDRFGVKPYDLDLCAHSVARALWNNPQIVELRMITSDKEEIEQFIESLRIHNGLMTGGTCTVGDVTSIDLQRSRERVDYPMPPVVIPDSYPYKYPTGHVVRGTNLTDLHCDVLRHVRRFGEHTPIEDTRQEVMGLYSEWRAPFDLGPAFEPVKDAFEAYSCLMPDPVDLEAGASEEPSEYTYYDRLTRPWIRCRGEFTRSNWMPVWIPGDEVKSEPPCLVGVYIRRKVAFGVFRAHDLVNAWPKNFYLVKRTGERQSGGELDAVVLLSLQGGIRPENQEKARAQIEKYRPEGRPDIHSRGGVWGFCLDGDVGVAQLNGPKGILQEFRGTTEEEIRNNITAMGAWPAEGSECGWIGSGIRGIFE